MICGEAETCAGDKATHAGPGSGLGPDRGCPCEAITEKFKWLRWVCRAGGGLPRAGEARNNYQNRVAGVIGATLSARNRGPTEETPVILFIGRGYPCSLWLGACQHLGTTAIYINLPQI